MFASFTYVYGGRREALGVLLRNSLVWLGGMSQGTQGSGPARANHHASGLCGYCGWNSGSCAHKESALPAESSSQPLCVLLTIYTISSRL